MQFACALLFILNNEKWQEKRFNFTLWCRINYGHRLLWSAAAELLFELCVTAAPATFHKQNLHTIYTDANNGHVQCAGGSKYRHVT